MAIIERENAPLEWAAAQHNLGDALVRLAFMTRDAFLVSGDRLKEAIVAYRLALEERTRDRVPLDWATTQYGLGNALRTLYQSAGARLFPTAGEEAIAAYRLALEERTRNRVPNDWATTQHELGEALSLVGRIKKEAAYLEAAIDAFRLALEVRNPDQHLEDWEWTMSRLGGVQAELGRLENKSELLLEAINSFQFALSEVRNAKYLQNSQTSPVPIDYDLVSLETNSDGAKMRSQATSGTRPVQDKSIITKGRVRYLPLPLAAFVAQTSEASLRNWIDNRVKFDGKLIKTTQSLTKDIYVSEETVDRMKERFIKWPSNQPAGSVTLGETDDHSGFLPVSDAARIVGVSRRTMWLWASQGKAPTEKSLDIIKCTTSDHFYIREKDTLELAKLVPRSGLQRGRRPQATSQPN